MQLIQVDINPKNTPHIKLVLVYRNIRITAADDDALYATLELILLTQHECVIMGDFNVPHIDWLLQQPTPAPGSKLLQFIADNGLSQHVQEPIRQNNILDLVITTEEALLLTLQIKDKIEDHQAIQYLLQTEKEETDIEKTNFNFISFEAMRADLDDERLERLIVNSDAARGFELLKNKILESCRRPIPNKHITINNPSWINNDV